MSCGGACAHALVRSEKCAKCACVWLVFVCAMCHPTFEHFLEQNCQKLLLFLLKTIFRTSFPILEHLFLFYNTKHVEKLQEKDWKIAEKKVEKMLMCGCEVRPLKIWGAHTCACAPKSGRARCVRATQKRVATHTLTITYHGQTYVLLPFR